MTNQSQLDPKSAQAISAALENNWVEAQKLNQELLEKYPDDIDTLNRLAKAFSETGNINRAKKLYKKVIDLDSYNQIADKNLKRLLSLKKLAIKEEKTPVSVKADQFLEEPGKTTISPLVDIAMPQVLASLQIGDEVFFNPHKGGVTVTSSDGKRIGKLEATISQTIATNHRSGSKFEAYLQSVNLKTKKTKNDKSQVTVFIKETHRSPKVAKAPFPSKESTFTPYVRDEALLVANQAPVLTEADGSIEEIEVSEIPGKSQQTQSIEELAEKEQEENDNEEI